MSKDLLIMRHAHAKSLNDGIKFERELKNKGKRAAQHLGVWLAQNDLLPDRVLTSPALYAKTSAEKLVKSAGLTTKIIQIVPSMFDATSEDIIHLITLTPNNVGRLLIVGHNPAAELAAAEISTTALPKTKKDNYLPKASIACFEVKDDWAQVRANSAELREVVYGKKLPEHFPYPHPFGAEKRLRPAYYYRQSCAVPYRLKDGGAIEVLLVSSSARKHWVVPKGIHEPGMSAEESAAQEAREEAGAIGEISSISLGRYEHQKWGATCHVEVFPMLVTQELPAEDLEESHRARKWVSLPTAIELIENKDLAEIVSKLVSHLKEAES